MTDDEILDLFWAREEEAIAQTEKSYGHRLFMLAQRILRSREDAEETVNDTYMTAWETIPPKRPTYFSAYLAKICRHSAFGKLDWQQAQKRNAEVVALTEEMQLCIPDGDWEQYWEGQEIGSILDGFLSGISRDSRVIFLRRYWYGDSVAEIARILRISESKVRTSLHRTRKKLKAHLLKEGVSV